MEYLGEAIALGIDAVIFGVCCKLYLNYKNASSSIQQAPVLDINENLKEFVQSQADNTIPYCVIRGTVLSLGLPIKSINSPGVTGVIQKLTIKQHVITRSSAGFWAEHERTIQEVCNVTPFVIQNGSSRVEVIDALSASILDMDIIADQFEPSNPSLTDHLWGFFSGIKQRGLQSTEALLREGTLITGIGELTLDSDGSGVILQPPTDGTSYYLTALPISSLVRRLDQEKRTFKALTVLFGSIGIVLISVVARRWWKDRSRRLSMVELKRRLEQNRKARRRSVRDHDIPEIQLCVVCRENPREIILLPCGHVCLCEDCSEGIRDTCPVCRAIVENKAAAYIS